MTFEKFSGVTPQGPDPRRLMKVGGIFVTSGLPTDQNANIQIVLLGVRPLPTLVGRS